MVRLKQFKQSDKTLYTLHLKKIFEKRFFDHTLLHLKKIRKSTQYCLSKELGHN